MFIWQWRMLMVAGLLAAANSWSVSAVQAQHPSPRCEEVFLTIDANSNAPVLGEFHQLTLRDPITNALSGLAFGGPLVGLGAYGPIYTSGDFLIEYFWFSPIFGNLGGFANLHTVAGAGLFVAFLQPSAAPGDQLGIRISRSDGAPFDVEQVWYGQVLDNLRYGFKLNQYSDFADFQSLDISDGLILGAGTLGIFNFDVIPRIAEIRFRDADVVLPAGITSSSLSINTSVSEVVWEDGTSWTDPNLDILLGGGQFVISALLSGLDLFDLSDVNLGSGSVSYLAAGSTLWAADFDAASTQSPYWTLSGPHRHRPRHLQDLAVTCATVADSMMTNSAILNAMNAQFAADSNSYLSFRIDEGNNVYLSALVFDDRYLPPRGQLITGSSTDGNGELQIAAVNLGPLNSLFNLFEVNFTGAIGSGRFFGIPLGSSQIAQISLPLGAAPIHVSSDNRGVYEWGVPSGTLPTGITIDGVTIALPLVAGGSLRVSEVTRIQM